MTMIVPWRWLHMTTIRMKMKMAANDDIMACAECGQTQEEEFGSQVLAVCLQCACSVLPLSCGTVCLGLSGVQFQRTVQETA